MQIAFIGVGLMGEPMVENLLSAGHELILWNRTRSKAERFLPRARVVERPEQAIGEARMVISMLESGPVTKEVVFSTPSLEAFHDGQIYIDMSSISPDQAREQARTLARKGVSVLDAPVSGGTVGAAEARLSIMAGGDEAAYERAKAVFSALGKPHYMGPAGSGQLAKLANQSIVGVTIGAVAEALLLAERGGADPVAVREALLGGFASSRILDLHGERMIRRDFAPGARSRVQLKDMNLILSEAEAHGLHLPLAEKTRELYDYLVAMGHEGLDHSALYLALEAGSQGSEGKE